MNIKMNANDLNHLKLKNTSDSMIDKTSSKPRILPQRITEASLQTEGIDAQADMIFDTNTTTETVKWSVQTCFLKKKFVTLL